MRIEVRSPLPPGDAVRVDMPGLLVLAEVVPLLLGKQPISGWAETV